MPAPTSTECTPLIPDDTRAPNSVRIPISTQSRDEKTGGGGGEAYGYALILLSSCFFSTMTLLVHASMVYHGVALRTIVFFRGPSQGLMALLTIAAFYERRTVFAVPRHCIVPLVARGFFGALSMSLNYAAMEHLPLGIAMSIFFINPVFTFLLSNIVLGERIALRDCVASLVAIGGVTLVSNPDLHLNFVEMYSTSYVVGVCLSLLSAAVLSVAIVSLRTLGSQVHYMTCILSLAAGASFWGTLMGGPRLSDFADPTVTTIVAAVCISGFVGQLLFNQAWRYIRAGPGSVLKAINVPLSYALGLLFLGEVPHRTGLIGSALVVFGVGLIGIGAMLK